MLTWKEGPRELGCEFHKVGQFEGPEARVHVDVFVLPKLAPGRPIAVTLRGGLPRRARSVQQTELRDPEDTQHLHVTLVPALERAGVSTGLAHTFVDDIVRLVMDEADAIRAAMATKTQ
jgi:hypothetical protein